MAAKILKGLWCEHGFHFKMCTALGRVQTLPFGEIRFVFGGRDRCGST